MTNLNSLTKNDSKSLIYKGCISRPKKNEAVPKKPNNHLFLL